MSIELKGQRKLVNGKKPLLSAGQQTIADAVALAIRRGFKGAGIRYDSVKQRKTPL